MGNKILIQDLAQILAAEKKLSKDASEDFVKAFFETITSVLETDKNVKVKGFGTFKLVDIDSRESVDVNTGERIRIDSHQKVSFTPEAALKKRINKPFEQFETVVINDGVDIESIESLDNKRVAEASQENVSPDTDTSNNDVVSEKKEPITEAKNTEQSSTKIEHVISPMQMQLEIKKNADEEEVNKQAEELNREKNENRWLKIILLIIIMAILCVASYFAGYYKLLCPECETIVPQNKNVPSTPKISNTVSSDSSVKDTANIVKKANDEGQRLNVKTEKETQINEIEKNTSPLNPKESYRMVSTLAIHKMEEGENLYRVAQKYYGSKDFAVYIIRYNGFDDPNVVTVGTRVKIPRLER